MIPLLARVADADPRDLATSSSFSLNDLVESLVSSNCLVDFLVDSVSASISAALTCLAV